MTISQISTRWHSLLGQQSLLRLCLATLPDLLSQPQSRRLLRHMRQLDHSLPDMLLSPLPEAMNALVGEIDGGRPPSSEEERLRSLADLAVALNRKSQLGTCLRRSLIRGHYLRQAGLPLNIHFGARLTECEAAGELTGHAWLTLDGRPYFETAENWRGYTVMVSFPQEP